jgi:UDP-hydrolysing UDP-N-acetyl-D-glucosamine 2-epimerase
VTERAMARKICVVTGSRADYGLLRWLMQDIADDPRLTLQVGVTGMHLGSEFGDTYREIEKDGFAIAEKVDIGLAGDSASDISKAVGRGVIGFADVFDRLQPDIVIVLGDRFEILAAAQAAMFARIPIAHIHGGEVTEGAVDESIRHALTKMSHLHFVAAEPYRHRVMQMGERPEFVFNVGAIGVSNMRRTPMLKQDDVERLVGMKIESPTFLVTFHPVTLAAESSDNNIGQMLDAFFRFKAARFIFTQTNADAGGAAIRAAIDRFVTANADRAVFKASLGQQGYASALSYVDCVIGNSSSGLIEAPAAKLPTINIGDRQKGRLRSMSVIDCSLDSDEIYAAMEKALSAAFRKVALLAPPAYGDGETARAIHDIVASVPLDSLKRKSFYDVK